MDGWMDGWMDGLIDWLINWLIDGWMDGYIHWYIHLIILRKVYRINSMCRSTNFCTGWNKSKIYIKDFYPLKKCMWKTENPGKLFDGIFFSLISKIL